MLFVTNRRIEGSRRSQPGRGIAFAQGDQEPGASLFFCQRLGPEQYVELTAVPFFSRLRRSRHRQLLFYVHGFSCQPEARVFPDALRLQALCDALDPDLAEVVADRLAVRRRFRPRPRLLGRPAVRHRQRPGPRPRARQVHGLARPAGHRGDLPQARQPRRPLDGQPRAGDRACLLGARLRHRAGPVPQPVHGRGRRRQRPVRARPARRRCSAPLPATSSSTTPPTTSPCARARWPTSRTAWSSAASAIPARPIWRRRRPMSSPSTATTSTAATTGSATPTCWPTPPAGPAPCCATWSTRCAPAGSRTSRPDSRRLILGDAFTDPPAPANSDQPPAPSGNRQGGYRAGLACRSDANFEFAAVGPPATLARRLRLGLGRVTLMLRWSWSVSSFG